MPQLLILSRKCHGAWRHEDNAWTLDLYLGISGICARNIWGACLTCSEVRFFKVVALMTSYGEMGKRFSLHFAKKNGLSTEVPLASPVAPDRLSYGNFTFFTLGTD